jgi:hypothetical protein
MSRAFVAGWSRRVQGYEGSFGRIGFEAQHHSVISGVVADAKNTEADTS